MSKVKIKFTANIIEQSKNSTSIELYAEVNGTRVPVFGIGTNVSYVYMWSQQLEDELLKLIGNEKYIRWCLTYVHILEDESTTLETLQTHNIITFRHKEEQRLYELIEEKILFPLKNVSHTLKTSRDYFKIKDDVEVTFSDFLIQAMRKNKIKNEKEFYQALKDWRNWHATQFQASRKFLKALTKKSKKILIKKLKHTDYHLTFSHYKNVYILYFSDQDGEIQDITYYSDKETRSIIFTPCSIDSIEHLLYLRENKMKLLETTASDFEENLFAQKEYNQACNAVVLTTDDAQEALSLILGNFS